MRQTVLLLLLALCACGGDRQAKKALEAAGEIDRVELVGLCTDICVISNALLCKAFCPELPVSVDAACCAGVTPENHRNALSAMQCCQIDVLNIAPDAK